MHSTIGFCFNFFLIRSCSLLIFSFATKFFFIVPYRKGFSLKISKIYCEIFLPVNTVYKKATARRYHTFSQKWYLLAKAYYSAESQNTPLLRYSNGSFIRLQNTHPFLLLNIPQTAENQGFFESRQTVSIFTVTGILYCIAKVCNVYSGLG